MQEENISRFNLEQCQKCDICSSVCPMKEVNPLYPGPKQAGPDGERYRLKDAEYYDYALKYCLSCKRCEVACPSNVNIADIISEARLKYGKPSNLIRDWTLANTDLVGSMASPLAGIANPILGLTPVKALMHALIGVDRHRTFPAYSSTRFDSWFRKNAAAQEGYQHYVGYFHGCYVNYNFPQLGKDLVALINACGYGVRLLEKEKCCGIALVANGFRKQAVKQAQLNVTSMHKALDSGCEAVLTSSSSCTLNMRDEYPHLLNVDNKTVRDSLMLATKWVCEMVEEGSVKLAFKEGWTGKAAYHTACHLQKLGWQVYSINLLRMIPGLELTVLDQECCGISGTYGFKKENYKYSQAVGSKLFGKIAAAGVPEVITDCETCKWQIEMSTGLPVRNPISVLVDALDLEKTKELNK